MTRDETRNIFIFEFERIAVFRKTFKYFFLMEPHGQWN
jgi:hypothetical protein